MTWYVVAEDDDGPVTEAPARPRHSGGAIYTISEDPKRCGWENDCGQERYGLTYEKARYICDVLNGHERDLTGEAKR